MSPYGLSFAGHPKDQLPLLTTRHLTSYKGGLLPHEARSGSEAGGHKRCRATRYSDNRDEEALLFEVHTTHLSQSCSLTIAIAQPANPFWVRA